MWKTLSLILPVLIPSWQFFKVIEPSPRIQWRQQSDCNAPASDWREFRPRPSTISPLQMIARLFWNPHGNDRLFAMSCAERIQHAPTCHSITEIKRRILCDPLTATYGTTKHPLQFRLVFVHRDGATLTQDVVFLSAPFHAQSV